MRTVSFPNLGINDIELNRFISFFGFDIAWYAVLITVGFLIGSMYAIKNMKRYGLDPDSGMDAILIGMLSAIVGARLYYVAFSWENYKDDLMSIFSIREGGLAIYGGIIAALLAGTIVCKVKKINPFAMFDVVSVGFLIGQSIGRWGNFVNIEAYGSATSESYLFAMTSNTFEGAVHPCFLYESIWCAIGIFVIHYLSKKRVFDGQVFLMYCIWYGFERMIVEGFRTDSLYWGPFRVSQILSGVIVVLAIIIMLSILSKIKRENDPNYLPLYVTTEQSKEVVALADLREKNPEEYKKVMLAKKQAKKDKKNKKSLPDTMLVENDVDFEKEIQEEKEIPDILEQDEVKKLDGVDDISEQNDINDIEEITETEEDVEEGEE